MLSEYFGLVMDPFESGPDPRFLYMDGARRIAFAQLLSSVYECKGTVVLASDRGLGKSTLIRHLADQLAALDSVLVLYPGGVLNCRPAMSYPDILAACRGRFDRRDKTGSDADRLIATLERAASESQAAVLLLDDADNLDDITLARLGQLSAPDSEDRRLVSVILAGSPAIAERLGNLGGADGQASAVNLFVEIAGLRDRDVDRLIRHRLSVAGHDGADLFSPAAMAEISRRARGNAMRVIALCSASLALAEREKVGTVSRELVDRAADRMSETDIEDPAPVVLRQAASLDLDNDWNARKNDREEPREHMAMAMEPRPAGTAKRLDDVAEAIRAADMRSTGGVDPHIKYGPYSPGPAPSASGGTDRDAPVEPRAAPAADGYRVYPGARPTATQPGRRRGGLAKAVFIGIILAVLAAGGVYVFQTGAISAAGIADQVGALAARIVRAIDNVIEADTGLDDVTSQGESVSDDRTANTDTTGLSFERFGVAPHDDRRANQDAPYSYAPPPPHGGTEPPAQAPSPVIAVKPDVVPPPPAVAPPASLAEAEPSPPALSQPGRSDAAAEPPASATLKPETERAGSDDFDLLDPTTAVILSHRGPQPAPKPAPPSSPANRNAAALPAPSAPAKPAEPVNTNTKPETERAQVQPLLTRGDEYLGSGDLDMARTFYQMAYDRGSAEAAIRIGWTFDPQYFQRIGLRGEASPREAILWYQEALRRGSRQAPERLSDLATWLQNAASSGDVEAQRILRLWQG